MKENQISVLVSQISPLQVACYSVEALKHVMAGLVRLMVDEFVQQVLAEVKAGVSSVVPRVASMMRKLDLDEEAEELLGIYGMKRGLLKSLLRSLKSLEELEGWREFKGKSPKQIRFISKFYF